MQIDGKDGLEVASETRREHGSRSSGGAMPPEWRVLETRRHRERVAQAALERAEIEAYLPMLQQWPRPAVGADVGPMFPGYLFARMTAAHVHRVCRTVGVRGLVQFGDAPAYLDDAAIDFLRSREEPDGIIRARPLPTGSSVVIADGPLRGLVAVVERRLTSRQRVLVLLDILRRQTRVEVPDRWIRQA